MSQITENPNDPRIRRGPPDEAPVPQHDTYLVLSAEERAKGFVRPYRDSYVHVGDRPNYPLRDLTDDERERYAAAGYAKYEPYPETKSPVLGRFWTRNQLDAKACGALTKMGRELSETYARDPHFYGATYCVGCRMHRPVAEFVWDGTQERVGT